MSFNQEKTFFMLSSGVGPKFYFFYPDGKVFKKGDFHEFTGDNGTSYGGNFISKSCKVWCLSNNLKYYFNDKSKLTSTISNSILSINENTQLGLFYKNINLKKGIYIYEIIDLNNSKCIYQSNEILTPKRNFKYEITSK